LAKETLADQIYRKVADHTPLTPLAEYDDLKTIAALDGREVGQFRAFTGDKIEKFSIAEISFAPGMDYTNASLRSTVRYNIPHFACNYMEMKDGIQFDVDLYPAVDLALRQDYIDKYYEQLTDIYLQTRNASHFAWKLSDHAWTRVRSSPYFFMSSAAIKHKDDVCNLLHAYLDVELNILTEEQAVSDEESAQIEYRMNYLRKVLLEREPERQMVEKVLGKELTQRFAEAMV